MSKIIDEKYIEEAKKLKEKASPSPWFCSYSTIHSGPKTEQYHDLESKIPEDAPDEAYDVLPDTTVCFVPAISGDTPTAQWIADARYIEAACNDYLDLLEEIERLRSQNKFYSERASFYEEKYSALMRKYESSKNDSLDVDIYDDEYGK